MIRSLSSKTLASMILLFFCCTAVSFAAPQGEAPPAKETAEQLMKRQLEQLHPDQVSQYWERLMKEYGGFFPGNQTPTLLELMMPGGEKFEVSTVLKGLLKYFLHEVLYNGKLLATIVLLTVFSMILETIQSAFERNMVSKIAYAIIYMVLLIIAVNSFTVAIGYAKSAIASMIDFMMAMVPLLLTLLATLGNVVSVTVIHPLIVFMVHAVGALIYVVVFPLLFFSAVLHIVSALSDRFKVTQLANLLRNISVALLGVVVTVFLGVVSVQGATAAIADGVTVRTAKYITGNFIPVVGKMFSDAADTVISASLLVKNAVGLAGVIILIFLCAFPALKILTLALIYNVSAAVMQPLGNSPIVTCLDTIGKSMIFVFAALAAVGLMFFLAVTIIITVGNISVMMR